MHDDPRGAAPDTPPETGLDLTTAMAGFMGEFKGFAQTILSRIQTQDDRIMKLDRKALSQHRPALATEATTDGAPHQKAFAAYLRSGDDEGLRALPLEGKALGTSVAADGGYLVDPETSAMIASTLASTASLRAVASVVQVDATSYDVLIDHGDMGAGWGNETSSLTETATPKIDRISIELNELNAMPKCSQRLLDDSAFDIEAWLAGRIAEKFARSEAQAFISGDGVDKPVGIMSYPTAPVGSESWGDLGYVATGTDGDFDAVTPADIIIDLVYSLGAQYRANATFVMNSKTAGRVRKLKDADGRFFWADAVTQGEPARLLGYPVLICEDMPDIASNATAIAFGDFAAGYTIAERPDLRVLRDPFSAKPHVLFYATKRVGGAVSDYAAIKLLKFGLS